MDSQLGVVDLVGEPDTEREALDRLYPLVYEELRRIARRQLRGERASHTLNTTGLVHEAYLRISPDALAGWADSSRFLALAATAMRRVLIDHARRHRSTRRGGQWRRIPLEAVDVPIEERAEMLLALDASLTRLAALDERRCRVVECRFFGGLTEQETAAALNVGVRTVKRDWAKAKAWLYRDMYQAGGAGHLTPLPMSTLPLADAVR